MTRLDILRTGTTEEIAELLCDLIQEYSWLTEEMAEGSIVFPHSCRSCPANKTCKPKHHGFVEWLQEEMKGESDGEVH